MLHLFFWHKVLKIVEDNMLVTLYHSFFFLRVPCIILLSIVFFSFELYVSEIKYSDMKFKLKTNSLMAPDDNIKIEGETMINEKMDY